MRRLYRYLWVGTLILLQREGVARAQTDEERASARSAAQQGVTAWKEKRYAEAVDMLKRAESVVHAPTHLLYLARSYEKLGKLVSARESYLRLAKEQLSATSPKPFRDAKSDGAKELALLEPRVAYVKIVVEGAPQDKTRVLVDDVQVPTTLVGVPQPTDPGSHRYQALAEGMQSPISSVKVEEGAKQTVTVTLRPAPGVHIATGGEVPAKAEQVGREESAAIKNAPAPKARVTSDDPSSSSASGLRIGSYVGLGVGLVGLGAGAYFFYLRSTRVSESDAMFTVCNPRVCNDDEVRQIQTLDARAGAAQRSANIAFVVGGVGVAAGLTMLIVDATSKPSTSESARVRPWIGAGSFGFDGRF